MEYCYFCNRWFAQGEDWDSHCRQKHLSPPPTDCGVLTRCNTMIKPSFCPLCLGQPNLAPSIRMKSWRRNADALDHIFKSHFTEPFYCTLCKETLGTRDAVEHHLADRHNLSGRNGNSLATRSSTPAGELKTCLEVEDSPSACPSSAESLPDPRRPEPHAKPQSTPTTGCAELFPSQPFGELDLDLPSPTLTATPDSTARSELTGGDVFKDMAVSSLSPSTPSGSSTTDHFNFEEFLTFPASDTESKDRGASPPAGQDSCEQVHAFRGCSSGRKGDSQRQRRIILKRGISTCTERGSNKRRKGVPKARENDAGCQGKKPRIVFRLENNKVVGARREFT